MQFKLLVLFPFLIIEVAGFDSTFVNITVSEENRKLIVREGASSVEFSATVYCHPKCEITWYDQQQQAIGPINTEPKWIITADDEKKVNKLKINDVQVEDFGTYRIEAVNSGHKSFENFNLIVEAKPKIYSNTSVWAPKLTELKANTTISYEYNITGYPLPEIVWSAKNCENFPNCEDETFHPIPASMFSEETVASNEPFRVLSKLHFKPNQTTIIQCEAKNSLGTEKAKTGIFATDYGPGYGVVKLENRETITVGDDVEITCAYSKYFFSEKLEWIYSPALSYELFSIIPSKDNEVKNWESTYSHRSAFFMSDVQKNQSGSYLCYPDDALEYIPLRSQFVNLTVFEAIKPTVIQSNLNNGHWETLPGATIQMIIQVDGLPSPSINWFKDGNPLAFNDRIISTYNHKNMNLGKVTVVNVSSGDDGIYSFIAFNKAGNVSESLKLSIITVSPEESKYVQVSCFFVLVFFVVASWYAIKQYKEKKELKEMLRQLGLQVGQNNDEIPTINPDLNIEDQNVPYNEKYEFPKEKLEFGEVLGSGAFGIVKKARADGIIEKNVKTAVAVKIAKSDPEMLFVKYLASELKIMICLRHLHVVNLLGACTKDLKKGELAVIVEYCEYGNLRVFLSTRRKTFINQITASDEVDFTINSTDGDTRNDDKLVKTMDLMSWSLQLARGMSYIASRKILHGDLAARNVLLAQRRVVKIGDFGLSKSMKYENEQYRTSKTMLPIRWMAIESIQSRIFSLESDIWSFGITVWEIFSLAITPYSGVESLSNLGEILETGYRLEKPEFATTKIYEVMKSCWNKEPTSRPTFAELSKILEHLFTDSVQSLYARTKGITRSESVSVSIREVRNYMDILDLTDEDRSNSTEYPTNLSANISPQTTVDYIGIRNMNKPNTTINNQSEGENSSEYSAAVRNMNIPRHHPTDETTLEYIEMAWKPDSNE